MSFSGAVFFARIRLITALTEALFGTGERASRTYSRGMTPQRNAQNVPPPSVFTWPLKLLIALGVPCMLVIMAWVAGRVTGHLQFYSVPTVGNEPAIKAGDFMLASDLVTMERGAFLCYTQTNPRYERATWVQRLVGMEGDTVELRLGRAVVNGIDVDVNYRLKHGYLIPMSARRRLIDEELITPEEYCQPYGMDSAIIHLPEDAAEARGYPLMPLPGTDGIEFQWSDSTWTAQEFGPVIVPSGHFFLLGDNRDASLDSRFIGPVPKREVVAIVFATF